MDQHEAAAAEIAGARIGHRQRKADGDRGIHRIAALPQNVDADARRNASCATTMPFLATTACAWPICSSLRAAIGRERA